MNKTKILIADDHTIVRIGLTALLNAEKDMEVVGEAKKRSRDHKEGKAAPSRRHNNGPLHAKKERH